MTENEMKLILENMNLEDLKSLQKNYHEYLMETHIINNLKRNLFAFNKDRNNEVKSTKKELEVKKAINTLKNLPRKKRYLLKGNLNKHQRIENLEIEGQDINKDVLENSKYSKMLFKKTSNGLYNAMIFGVISIILFNIGISADLIALKIIAILSVFPAIMNYVSYACNDTLNPSVKKHISKKKISSLIKKLQNDYVIEKENSENIHLQNQLFLESKEDIFNRMLKTHKAHLSEITEEIRKIIESDIHTPMLTEEEIVDTQTLLTNSKPKALKKSL